MKQIYKTFMIALATLFFIQFIFKFNIYAADLLPLPSLDVNIVSPGQTGGVVTSLQILFLFVIITLIPALLVSMTCFTRIIIAMYFIRTSLSTQQMPPNQVLIGLALFLTLFLMGPTLSNINENALIPYTEGVISQEQFFTNAMEPIREFMFRQVEDKDMALFVNLADETYETAEEIPNRVLIPAFILGEITKGFKFGFFIFLPFIVIDMIVASVLMAMGMMMLPPAMISLPFKILLFVMVDGWSLIIENLIRTFR